MTDPRLFRLRVAYVEQGRLAMLSHLEVARALERSVRRANLPFAVSQGFSPHMKIAFGAALPVGVGSTCEVFDLQLTTYVAPAKALAALREASVPDLMVQDCKYIEHNAPAASVAFPFSTYEVRFSRVLCTDEVCVPETVTVVRKRKEKVLVVDEFLAEPFIVTGDRATFTLEAKPTGSLRPDVLVNRIVEYANAQSCGGDAPLSVLSITRVRQSAEIGA